MFPDEAQEKDLRTTLLVLRLQGFAMCYAAPVIYAVVYAVAVLHGRWDLLFQGFGAVPWSNPLVLGLLAVSGTTLAAAFTVPRLLPLRRGLADLRTRGTLAFALLETVAIFGLVLGFLLGPPAASLVLVLLLVPAVFCPLLLVGEEQAREALRPHV